LLKGAIFDLGETLIHLTVSWEQVREWRIEAIDEALRNRGVTLEVNDVKQQYMRLHDEESDYAARTLEEIEIEGTFSRLLDRLGVGKGQRPAMTDLVKRSFELEVNSWALFPGIQTMLQQVRDLGLKVGLLSNARSDWAIREIMEQRGLTSYFDSILTSAAIGIRKPRPEPFLQMLEQLHLQANEVVMIGNSMEADIAGAKPLGIKTIHVTFGENEDEDGPDPDVTVSAVPEIIPAIRRIAASC